MLRSLVAVQRIAAARPMMWAASRSMSHSASTDPTEADPVAFNKFWVSFFNNVEDQFELRRGTTDSFSRDIVPGPEVIVANLRASRRLDDYANAMRALERLNSGLKRKEYDQYLEDLTPTMQELGITEFHALFKN